MKKVLFLFAAVLTALSVFAKDVMVARAGNDSLTLHDAPCSKKVAALLKPEYVARFRAATDKANGKVFKACWTLHDQDHIFVLYEDGDRATVPLDAFQEVGKGKPVKPLKGSV
jgi:hypothetical protein